MSKHCCTSETNIILNVSYNLKIKKALKIKKIKVLKRKYSKRLFYSMYFKNIAPMVSLMINLFFN